MIENDAILAKSQNKNPHDPTNTSHFFAQGHGMIPIPGSLYRSLGSVYLSSEGLATSLIHCMGWSRERGWPGAVITS